MISAEKTTETVIEFAYSLSKEAHEFLGELEKGDSMLVFRMVHGGCVRLKDMIAALRGGVQHSVRRMATLPPGAVTAASKLAKNADGSKEARPHS